MGGQHPEPVPFMPVMPLARHRLSPVRAAAFAIAHTTPGVKAVSGQAWRWTQSSKAKPSRCEGVVVAPEYGRAAVVALLRIRLAPIRME